MKTNAAVTERFNGWSNYETWAVASCLDNDEESYKWRRAAAREAFASHESAATAISAFAEQLKATHEEDMPEVGGVFADLLGAALGEVDWYEIAEHYINEVVHE